MHSDSSTVSHAPRGRTAGGLLALMRPVNAVVTIVGIASACVIAGADGTDIGRISLAAVAGMLLASAGNIINDVYDVAIDRINKPQRAIAAGMVSPRAAVVWSAICGSAGLALSVPLGNPALLIASGSAVLMFVYSSWLKRLPLIGNFAVGILTGAAFLYGSVAFGNPAAGIIPALFALFFNAAREILKDVEDMNGDARNAVRTFPLVAGKEAALGLVSGLLVLVILGSALPFWFSVYGKTYFWVVLIGVDTVLGYVLFAMWNDRSTGNLARLNLLLKYDMLVGIAAIVLGTR